MKALPIGFEWHQSRIGNWLRCPRSFYLRWVLGEHVDHEVSNYAAPTGTAMHEVIARALANPEWNWDYHTQLADSLAEEFEKAVEKDALRGRTPDPDLIEAAMDRLLGDRLAELEVLLADPRMQAIEWLKAELDFDWVDNWGRKFKGIIDAVGRAKHDVPRFGVLGRDPCDLAKGDLVVVDWKTGVEVPLGHAELSANVQLAFYESALRRAHYFGPFRLFIGVTRDAGKPKRPKDANGDPIPSKVSGITKEWLAATGLKGEAAEKSRKRPKDADGKQITKRWEEPNTAYADACSRPKGPIFHEAKLDYRLALGTASAAIRAAEAGLFPASGALTGQCKWCTFRARCAHREVAE